MKTWSAAMMLGFLAAGCSHSGSIDTNRLTAKNQVVLSNGKPVQLPLQYRNWKWMMATYAIPAQQAEKLLPAKLKPVLLFPGKALISVGVLEYPEVSGLKPYNEWLVSIPVQYDPAVDLPFLPLAYNPLFPHDVYSRGGSYIHYLPVTTEESRQVGTEIWGFPKVQRQIHCTEDADRKTCDLLDNGKFEMRLVVGKLPPNLKRRPFAYCAYTDKDQQLLRTCIQATGNYAYTASGSASLTLGSGSVPEGLGSLGIRGKQPIQVFYAENLESTLNVAYENLAK